RLSWDFEVDDVVAVEGVVNAYQENLQLVLTALQRLPDPQWEDYLATDPQVDAEELLRRLDELRKSIADPGYRALVEAVFTPDFLGRFAGAPAAQRYHHAYRGGLLEHTVNVASIASRLAEVYPQADRDLLVAGALLHDAGKVAELQQGLGGGISYTTAGRLLTHSVLGVLFLERTLARQAFGQVETPARPESPDALAAPGIPVSRPALTVDASPSPEQVLRLEHLILSHHGQHEYGAPVLPATLEAWLLHFADNIDARAKQCQEAARSGQEWVQTATGAWIYTASSGRCAAPPEAPDKSAAEEAAAPPSTPPADPDRNQGSITPDAAGEVAAAQTAATEETAAAEHGESSSAQPKKGPEQAPLPL
ncbi:MAG: HD domain-containing protein, partial [Bacillota bacterium]|nr:HD domain-containing protein [Bacillota bacterium]